jgi:heme O synthase-like polyprenyltransferase
MISERDAGGHRTARQIVVWGWRWWHSAPPTVTGLSGPAYAITALLLGAAFLLLALALLLRAPSDARALRVFLASVTYLPVLLFVMVLEKLLA